MASGDTLIVKAILSFFIYVFIIYILGLKFFFVTF